jgi:adenylate cyclase
MDPEVRRRRLFGVLRRLVQSPAEGQPSVTLIEDLHWLDMGSEAWLEQWVDAIGGTTNLLLVDFRPEYHADWMHKSWYHQLPLSPLGPEAIEELLEDLLGSDPSMRGVAEAIHRRTAGNPFFIEELIQELIESGQLEGTRGRYRLVTPLESLEVPGTVQSLLAARIDRLAEREKQLLQTAAVIGREFTEPLLEAIVELPRMDLSAGLQLLKSGEFIYEQALYPVAEYAFKHPLTQEVALKSQLQERRRRIHAAVAHAIEGSSRGKLEEQASVLAHHWEEADEPLEAARWHHRAAEWVAIKDPEGAMARWRKARALLTTINESPEVLTLGAVAAMRILAQGWRAGLSDEEAAILFEDGKGLASRSGDLRLLALLTWGYGAALGFAGELKSYLRACVEAERLAEQAGDAQLQYTFWVGLAYSHFLTGELREALTLTERALEHDPGGTDLAWQIGGFSPQRFFLGFKPLLLSLMGRLEEAAALSEPAIEKARDPEDTELLVPFLGTSAVLARWRGEGEAEALARAGEAFEIAERGGSSHARVQALNSLGLAHILMQDWSAAIEALEDALATAREHRTGLHIEALLLTHLARAQLGLGESERACQTADQALAVAQHQGARLLELDAQLARAHALGAHEGARARGAIERALECAGALLEETAGTSFAPLVHLERARLASLGGDQEAREHELREAHRLFTEMGAKGNAQRVAKELGL